VVTRPERVSGAAGLRPAAGAKEWASLALLVPGCGLGDPTGRRASALG